MEDLTAAELVTWVKSLFDGTETKIDPEISGDYTVMLTLNEYFDAADQILEMDSTVQSKGWYITHEEGLDYFEDDVQIWFHKIKGEPVDVPHFIYHMTTAEAAEKIKTTGLKLARGGIRHGFKYPPRTYFVRDPKDVKRDVLGFDDTKNTVILKINTSKVPGLKLFMDPQYPTESIIDWQAAYAETVIPSIAIEVIDASDYTYDEAESLEKIAALLI